MASKPKSARVRKSDGVELYALTVRLPPRVKIGLELLARLQGRPLSQAVDWALQYTLANVHANEEQPEFESGTLAELAEMAENHVGWERAYWLYVANPVLVKFEERHACRILMTSEERKYFDDFHDKAEGRDLAKHEQDELAALFQCWRLIATDVWPNLLQDSDELVLAPNASAGGISLTELYYPETLGLDIAKRMRVAAKTAKEKGVTVPPVWSPPKTMLISGNRIRLVNKVG